MLFSLSTHILCLSIATFSFNQVHRAVLKDGSDVVMKIQYPGVADSIESDIENVRLLLTYTNLIPKGLFLDRAMKVNFFIHYVSRDMDGSHCFFFIIFLPVVWARFCFIYSFCQNYIFCANGQNCNVKYCTYEYVISFFLYETNQCWSLLNIQIRKSWKGNVEFLCRIQQVADLYNLCSYIL